MLKTLKFHFQNKRIMPLNHETWKNGDETRQNIK